MIIKKPFNVNFDLEEMKEIDKIAVEEEKSRSLIIRKAVSQYLENRKLISQ